MRAADELRQAHRVAALDEVGRHPTARSSDRRPLSGEVQRPRGAVSDVRLRPRSWLGLVEAVVVTVLAVASALVLVERPPTWSVVLLIASVAALITVVLAQRRATVLAGRRRIARERRFTRIVQGLSRSVSPDAVVDAIVEELRASSGADHVVVARQVPDDGTVEVTVVSSSEAVPTSRTQLRADILGAPGGDAGTPGRSATGATSRPGAAGTLRYQQAADEIARRVRSGYGLPFTLAVPLVWDERFFGALMLSKRTRGPWSDVDQRLLSWAGTEVSAALARTYALEAAEQRANHDALTGLPNRRYLEEVIGVVPRRRREGDALGALMIDIDHFKALNDRYGHATGDAVLRAVAGAITVSTRAEDTPARYGGEEFAVILRRADTAQAAVVGERIRRAVAAIPAERLGIDGPVTVSVGVAVAEDGESLRTVLERADRALYLAKRRGRDRVEVA